MDANCTVHKTKDDTLGKTSPYRTPGHSKSSLASDHLARHFFNFLKMASSASQRGREPWRRRSGGSDGRYTSQTGGSHSRSDTGGSWRRTEAAGSSGSWSMVDKWQRVVQLCHHHLQRPLPASTLTDILVQLAAITFPLPNVHRQVGEDQADWGLVSGQ